MVPETLNAPPAPGPLGLLGGSFDPVHAGHLALARAARAALRLAQVHFIPAGQPWQKPGLTPAPHRLAMLRVAVAGQEGTHIDTREIVRGGASYTIDTLRELRAEVGDARPLVWILGFDQLCRLDTWKRWDELSGLAHFAYTARAGSAPALTADVAAHVAARQGSAAQLAAQAAGTFVEFAMPPVDCSATQIRAALARGEEARAAPFLAPGVLAYIHTHQLYTAAHGQ